MTDIALCAVASRCALKVLTYLSRVPSRYVYFLSILFVLYLGLVKLTLH
jgi:hypothetical protein